MVDYAPGFYLLRRPIQDFLNPAAPEMAGASDTESILRDGALYTWVAGYSDAGIQLIRHDLTVQSNLQGFGTILGSVKNEDVGGLTRVSEIETIKVGQNTFLLSLGNPSVNTAQSSVLNSFAIGPDLHTPSGGLTLVDSVASGGSMMNTSDFFAVKVGGKAFVLTWTLSTAGQTGQGAIGVHQLRSNGTLVATSSLAEFDNPAMPLKDIADVQATTFQGRTLVLTGSTGTEGLGLWTLNSAGQLTLLDTAKTFQDQSAPGISADLNVVHITTVGDRAFAFAYDTGASRITTYEVVGDALVYRSDTSFTSAFNFQTMNEMKSFIWGGHLFLVASVNSNLALMAVGEDGSVDLASTANSSLSTVFNNTATPPISGISVVNAALSNVAGFDILEENGSFVISAASTSSEALNILLPGANSWLENMAFFEGTAGDDRFFGLFNGMDADGLGGNDQFFAGGKMAARGGDGADSLYGATGNDSLTGGSGADILLGDDGDDILNGGLSEFDTSPLADGADSLEGGAGRDTINGGASNDTIHGGTEADVIDGGTFDDWIDAGSGGDRITMGAGFDTVNGGAGTDDFVFNTNVKNNHDQIVGFELGFDQIKFKGTFLNTFAEVQAATTQVGADAVILMRPGHSVTLVGIDVDNLTASNFLFD